MKNMECQKGEVPSVFTLMRQGEYSLVEEVIRENVININCQDNFGNDVMMRLLKLKQYDLIMDFMKKKNWDVNHQNEEGNTFAHLLAQDSSLMAIKVMENLIKKTNYIPNIKNNRGETAMDIALSHKSLCTAFKILEDKRFNSIDVFSFRHLFDASIKNELYGKYSKITNFEIIVDSLGKKELNSKMSNLLKQLEKHKNAIKENFMKNDSSLLETIIENQFVMA